MSGVKAAYARDIGDSLVARGVALSLGGQLYDPADTMGKMFLNILATIADFAELFSFRRATVYRVLERHQTAAVPSHSGGQ